MINPQPVDDRRSPYSSAGTTPTPNRPVPPLPTVMQPKRPRPWRKIIGYTVLTLIVAGLAYGYSAYRSLKDSVLVQHQGQGSAILGVDLNDKNTKLDLSQFTTFGDGRFNVVIVGVGGDNHPGAYLTDSIQVVSLDTINKKFSVTSVPRDLYVNIPGYGRSKINAAYEVGESKQAGGGATLLRQVIGNVLGVKVSNFALMDFSGLKDIVDALGGIDVNVPKTIDDPYYPDDANVGYQYFHVNAGLQHMDGSTALKYTRSRETTSDFDRSARQQLVMQAIKAKALSAGILANPVKTTNLINALGKHFRTDMTIDQIKTVLNIYRDIPQGSTTTNVLDTSDQLGLLTAITDPIAGYISYPLLGFDKFDDVHEWFAKNNPDPLLARENPSVTIFNTGRATEKQMQAFATKLRNYGYTVTISTDVASRTKYTTTTVFAAKSSESKTVSRNYLGSLLSTSLQNDSPFGTTSDFEVVYVPSTK